MSSVFYSKMGSSRFRARVLAALLLQPCLGGGAVAATFSASASASCRQEIRAAEATYRLPPGLLEAISEVESGRIDAATGRVAPWPWAVQAGGQSLFFAGEQEAVQWVHDATARGTASIDTGCLQVNLLYHPHAFATLDEAFDPHRNVDYAARFLLRLYGATGDWRQATGFYHSQTRPLAQAYTSRVEQHLRGGATYWMRPSPHAAPLDNLMTAWQATLPSTPSDAVPAELDSGRDWSVLARPVVVHPVLVRHLPLATGRKPVGSG